MKTKHTKGRRRPAPKKVQSSVAEKSRRHRAAAGKRPQRKSLDTEIVYTQPKPFALSTFVLRLVTVVAVVAALVLGMAIFFKVGVVNVSGGEKYSPWDVKVASGIQDGENLLTLNKSRIVGKIKTELRYVDEVRIGIKLPNAVNIEITEQSVTYAIEADNDTWWLMDAKGKLLETLPSIDAKFHTQILGVTITEPQAGYPAVAVEPEPETITETDEAGNPTEVTLPASVQGREKLDAALTILQCLEDNDILGQMESVDVTDINNMEMWYSDRYHILLGDTTQLAHKIKSVTLAIGQMSEYQTGVLDASFTLWPDQIGYNAFEQE